jgi:type III restriction enzyme
VSTINLFEFQQTAANQMVEAVEEWMQLYAEEGPSYLGKTVIPFVGHLKAVTGAGKTPILAKVVGDLKHGLVLWTSKSSAVVDQTVRNLTGKYNHLLPPGTRVMRERPTRGDWEELIESESGITIWVTTVGSWNEAEAAEAGGSESARLNMHRPQKDWGGEKSPWQQLRTMLKRPLWVVYDESHNQTPVQLDQLTGLSPVGFLMASATPPSGGQFDRYAEVIKDDANLSRVAAKGRVTVFTRDVVEKQLLKHTIAIENFNSDSDVLLDATIELHRRLQEAAAELTGFSVQPKALYVVEKSNPTKGEITSRPEIIWEHLRSRGVSAEDIAVYTQTKTLPEDAVRVSSLAELQPHHTHIICNRALQEGWDDPEAYIEYFDDESNSYTRISQVIGRALRQPNARHLPDDDLNTATLFVRVPNKTFDSIVEGLKRELALYATDEDDPSSSAIRVRTRKEPLDPVPPKADHLGKFGLPRYQLGEADLDSEIKKIEALSRSPFSSQDLVASGGRSLTRISLRGEKDSTKYELIASSMRRQNGEYLRRRIQIRSRHCAHLIDPIIFTGPAFEQWSCSGSVAQELLNERAAAVVQAFETSVELVPSEILGEEVWTPGPHQPTVSQFYDFNNAIHPRYAKNSMNAPELDFARSLDDINVGVWTRNPSRGDGYGIQLPVKVGNSNTFYPDFLWWVKDDCYAIDPTGEHILDGKVRGKLLEIEQPKIVLVTPGRITPDWNSKEDVDGYTIVRARKSRSATPEWVPTLDAALKRIAGL